MSTVSLSYTEQGFHCGLSSLCHVLDTVLRLVYHNSRPLSSHLPTPLERYSSLETASTRGDYRSIHREATASGSATSIGQSVEGSDTGPSVYHATPDKFS
ncbi:hypothetical protein HGRIS_002257 [Hohenbuehelia grisea]|uniref:Uncharacterized protein n=1 Tax=Hohenbuehelia grisea TaxID=104357 RepID=A0ABR3JJY7_9AGAR